MFKKKKDKESHSVYIVEEFKKTLFENIVSECISKATELTNIKISKEIRYCKGFVAIKLQRYTYEDDTTTIKTRQYTFHSLSQLIVRTDDFIEKIERDFVER